MSGAAGEPTSDGPGPVLFAYDGSDLAKLAIAEAGRQLRPGREAIVVTVWQTYDVGFVPKHDVEMNAAQAQEVERAAGETAAEGAALAEAAGFVASTATVRASPTWEGIIEAADKHDAGLIAIGSHGRTGLASVLIGSVAEAIAAHSSHTVLIAHRRA
jgi:nucleotide-binding universal stress UspA family protein